MTSLSATYYVSQRTGSDENDGRTCSTAFASLSAVNRRSLQPGDRVLLERGSVFYGQYLHVTDSGTKEAPIVIGAYGTADAPPRIDACGQGIWYQDYGTPLDAPTHVYHGYVSSAVLLYDAEYIVVEDLEITNEGSMIPGERYSLGEKMNRTGVAVVAKDKGVRGGITLRNLWIHDVHGNVYDKHMNNGGIYMTALRPECEELTGVARYRDIVIEGCFVHRVSRWGIAAGYTYAHDKFRGAELTEAVFLNYGHENMQIRNNYVKEAGGMGSRRCMPCVLWWSIIWQTLWPARSMTGSIASRATGWEKWQPGSGPGNARMPCFVIMKSRTPDSIRTAWHMMRIPGTERCMNPITAGRMREAV